MPIANLQLVKELCVSWKTLSYPYFLMAGEGGFKPPHARFKASSLITWLLPNNGRELTD